MVCPSPPARGAAASSSLARTPTSAAAGSPSVLRSPPPTSTRQRGTEISRGLSSRTTSTMRYLPSPLPLTPTRPSHPRLHTLVFTLSSSLPPAASPPSSLARRSSHFHCQPPPPSPQSNVHRWPSCYPTTCSARHLSSSRSAPNRAVPAHLRDARARCLCAMPVRDADADARCRCAMPMRV